MMQERTVLLVEENIDTRANIHDILELEGFVVESASSVAQGSV